MKIHLEFPIYPRQLPEVPVPGMPSATARLCYSDAPQMFDVGLDDTTGLLVLRYDYPAATQEPRRVLLGDRVQAEVGVHSNRLFVLQVGPFHVRSLVLPKVAWALLEILSQVFTSLDGQATTLGTRLNYRVAREVLALERRSPVPGWLQGVLDRLRPACNLRL